MSFLWLIETATYSIRVFLFLCDFSSQQRVLHNDFYRQRRQRKNAEKLTLDEGA